MFLEKSPELMMNTVKTTAFVLTIGDPAFELCMKALKSQSIKDFRIDVIENVSPVSAADQRMIDSCETDYFVKVDEDMILEPRAIERMQQVIDAAEDRVAMVNFSLYDVDLEKEIHGIKIFRKSAMDGIKMKNTRASDIDMIKQLKNKGMVAVDFPEVIGRHGVIYSEETIYRRYKSMYEKEIYLWNRVSGYIKIKAEKYRKSGDYNDLFAILGAFHGIINAENIDNTEAKDINKYDIKELNILKNVLLEDKHIIDYDEDRSDTYERLLEDIHKVKWKRKIAPSKMMLKSIITEPIKGLSQNNSWFYGIASRLYHYSRRLLKK